VRLTEAVARNAAVMLGEPLVGARRSSGPAPENGGANHEPVSPSASSVSLATARSVLAGVAARA
jgi:hypothetical protein